MIRRPGFTIAVLGSAAFALAACNAPDDPAVPAASVEPAPAVAPASPPPVAANVLTAQGFGPLRIGMTRAEVEAALGPDATPGSVGGPEPEACDIFRPDRAPQGLQVMVENGILTNVRLIRDADIATDRGFRIGDPAAAVKAAYGASAEVVSHKYVEAPAEYVTVWTSSDHSSPAARGIKYEIGSDGNVQSIAAGGPSIQYVEGCA